MSAFSFSSSWLFYRVFRVVVIVKDIRNAGEFLFSSSLHFCWVLFLLRAPHTPEENKETDCGGRAPYWLRASKPKKMMVLQRDLRIFRMQHLASNFSSIEWLLVTGYCYSPCLVNAGVGELGAMLSTSVITRAYQCCMKGRLLPCSMYPLSTSLMYCITRQPDWN